MHLRRSEVPESWPVPRKGTKFLAVPSNNKEEGISVVILIRDMLEIAKNNREVERIIRSGKVKVNDKVIKEVNFALTLLDILAIDDKKYKLVLKNRKFDLEETKDNEKISKIIGKKILSGKRTQVNLGDGRNFITNEEVKVGDSVSIDFSTKKIKVIPLKEGSKVMIISGKYIGKHGKVESMNEKTAEISLDKEKANLELESVMAI